MPSDIPAVAPRGGYKTTNYAHTCPDCGATVECYYLVPEGGPGRVVEIQSPDHKDTCKWWVAS